MSTVYAKPFVDHQNLKDIGTAINSREWFQIGDPLFRTPLKMNHSTHYLKNCYTVQDRDKKDYNVWLEKEGESNFSLKISDNSYAYCLEQDSKPSIRVQQLLDSEAQKAHDIAKTYFDVWYV